MINLQHNMTKEEEKDWNELCEYIRYEILEYDNDMKFPKYLALRLKGLANGKFIANNKTSNNAHYSYKVILATFKICKYKIKNYLASNSAKIQDEQHKCNIIMKFAEEEINDVELRFRQIKKKEQEISKLELPEIQSKKSAYKQSEYKENKNLKNLW